MVTQANKEVFQRNNQRRKKRLRIKYIKVIKKYKNRLISQNQKNKIKRSCQTPKNTKQKRRWEKREKLNKKMTLWIHKNY